MTLAFRTKIKNKPTYFVEKILSGLHGLKEFEGFTLSNKYNHDLDLLEECNSKIHTIRYDKPDRWKKGRDIHFVINNRTKNRFQFAPIIKVKSTQKIEIKNVFCDRYAVIIDDRVLTDEEIQILAINDGFENVNDFWGYFASEEFEGKIIHWTSFLY